MARLSALLVGAAALGASAYPGARHGHLHQHKVRTDASACDMVTAVIDGVAATWCNDYFGAATATPTPTAASSSENAVNVNVNVNAAASATTTSSTSAATTTGDSSSSSDSSTSDEVASAGSLVDHTITVLSEYTEWSSICSAFTEKRATVAEISRVGNLGTKYGCNLAVTSDADVADAYDNYVEITGFSADQTCYVWNKAGSDGTSIDGFILSTGSYQTFDIAAGESKYVVIQNGTYGGASCQPATLSTPVVNSVSGAVAYTWVEWTMVDSTSGWSDVDASCIQAQLTGSVVNPLEVTSPLASVTSSVDSAGNVVNAWNADNIDADGLGINTIGTWKGKANFGFSG